MPELRIPIRVECEGSECPTHYPAMNGGICSMCGVIVTCRDDGTALPHKRNDVLAMLARGDFDQAPSGRPEAER